MRATSTASIGGCRRPIVKMLMVPVGPVSSFDYAIFCDCEEDFDFAIYYDCEDKPDIDIFYDCREPPELRHTISDTGCPIMKTEPCRHMCRTFKTSRTPVTQSNRYAEWVRCHGCGHTHAKMTYSSICCMHCKERYNSTIEEYRRQRRIHWTTRVPVAGEDGLGGGFHGGRNDGLDLALASNLAMSSGRAGFGFPASNSCKYIHLSPPVHPPGDAKYAHCFAIFPGLLTVAFAWRGCRGGCLCRSRRWVRLRH